MALIFKDAFDFLSGLNEVLESAKRSLGITSPTIITVRDTNGKAISMVVDCSLSLNTDIQVQVPGFPVEVGYDITDNAIAKPLRFRLTGLISETELTPFTNVVTALLQNKLAAQVPPHLGLSDTFVQAAISSGIKLAFAAVDGVVTEVAGAVFDAIGGFDTPGDVEEALGKRGGPMDIEYPKRAMQALKIMAERAYPLKVETYFDETSYNNMLIQSISFTQDDRTPDALNFSMDCVQIRTVATEQTKAEVGSFFAKATEGTVSDPAGSSAAPEKQKGTKTNPSTSLIGSSLGG